MTLTPEEEWERIRELRQKAPEAGTPEHERWNRLWSELLSDELLAELRDFVAKRFTRAEDAECDAVVNDILLKFYEVGLWRYEPSEASDAGLLGYLRSYARFQFLDRVRRRNRVLTLDDFAELIPPEEPQREGGFDLERLREQLSDVEKQVFSMLENVMREEHRRITLREIGAKLEKSNSTVWDIFNRIRQKAQKLRGERP